MSAKKHPVTLTDPDRQRLEKAVRSNKNSLRERTRARVLLAAGHPAEFTDAQVAHQAGCCRALVGRVRRRFAAGGRAAALRQAAQPRRKPRRLDGGAEARLVAVACSAPPAGRQRWTVRLLAGRLVEMEIVDSVSHETVRATLKKMRSSRG